MTTVKVNWVTCGDDKHWCKLETLNLSSVTGDGVYIIWHGGDQPKVVRVGQGNIADRLRDHRQNPDIVHHNKKGPLMVTWAELQSRYRDAVERYLYEQYSPIEGERHPDVNPVAVNSPWG